MLAGLVRFGAVGMPVSRTAGARNIRRNADRKRMRGLSLGPVVLRLLEGISGPCTDKMKATAKMMPPIRIIIGPRLRQERVLSHRASQGIGLANMQMAALAARFAVRGLASKYRTGAACITPEFEARARRLRFERKPMSPAALQGW